MSTTVDLGFLSLGGFISKFGDMSGGNTQTDIYKFSTGSVFANVSIRTGNSGVVPSNFALSLFRDGNGNGVLDNNDAGVQISDDSSDINNATETISINLPSATYFARARGFDSESFRYVFGISRARTGAANPLAGKEFQLGTIAQDLQRRNSVSDKDTADNFAFTLDGNSSLNIGVRELGNLSKGDVNVRVVQDLNGNGFVDKNEVVVKGVSSAKGNIDTIKGLKGTGDYILQVCQSQGDTNFQVKFDHLAV
jgi:uncharacterized protein (DUF2141 family)